MRLFRILSLSVVLIFLYCPVTKCQIEDEELLFLLNRVPELTNSKQLDQAKKMNKELLELSFKKSMFAPYIYSLAYEIEIQSHLGNYDKAEHIITKLRSALTENREPLFNLRVVAQIFIGDYYRETYQYDEAIKAYRKGVAIGDDNEIDEFYESILFTNLADVYLKLEKFDEALILTEKVLAIDLKDTSAENRYFIAIDYLNLGEIYLNTNLQKAKGCLLKSKAYRRTAEVTDDGECLHVYLNLADVYLRERNEPQALLEIDTLFQQINLKNRAYFSIAAKAFEQKGHIMKALFDEAEALANYEKSYQLYQKIKPDNYDCQRLLLQKSKCHFEFCDYEKSEKLLAGLFDLVDLSGVPGQSRLEKVSSPKMLFEAYWLEGQNKFHLYNTADESNIDLLEASATAYQNAMEVFKVLKVEVGEEMSQEILFNQNYTFFDDAIEVNYYLWDFSKNYMVLERIIYLIEMSKSIGVNNYSNNKIVLSGDVLLDSLIAKRKMLEVGINKMEKQLYYARKSENELLRNKTLDTLVSIRRDRNLLVESIANTYPDYQKLKYEIQVPDLSEIKNKLNSTEGLLMYYLSDHYIYGVTIEQSEAHIQRVPRTQKLGQSLANFNENITNMVRENPAQHQQAFQTYKTSAHFIYQQVFQPFEAFIPPEITIVPYGVLGSVAFDALLTSDETKDLSQKKLPYLLHDYIISYDYSVNRFLSEPIRDSVELKTFLAVAPQFDEETTTTTAFRNFGYLAYNREEVKKIKRIIGGDIYQGEKATEDNFLETASEYQILHLATHGKVDPTNEAYSYLAFNKIEDSLENELLYVKDIYGLELQADLVVLSACESGAGRLRRGEGIVSMARAFSNAGAAAVMPTLWKISDKNTANLMTDFYKNLKSGLPKNRALTNAKRKFLKNATAETASPFYWAPFVLIGNHAPVKIKSSGFLTSNAGVFGASFMMGVVMFVGALFWKRYGG